MIDRHPNGNCDVCHIKEDVNHYLLECHRYQNSVNRVKLKVSVRDVNEILKTEKYEETLVEYVLETKRLI